MVDTINSNKVAIQSLENMQSNALMFDSEVSSYRQHALERYRAMGKPARKQEQWKYANLNGFDPESRVISKDTSSISTEELSTWPEAQTIVLVDGKLHPDLASELAAGSGIKVTNLSNLNKKQLENYKKSLIHLSDSKNAMIELNLALCDRGIMIEVSKSGNDVLNVELIHVNTESGSSDHKHVHNVVFVEPEARVSIHERFVSLGASVDCSVYNLVTQVYAEEQSCLNFYQTNSQSSFQGYSFSHTRIELSKGCQYIGSLLSMSAGYARYDVEWNCKDPFVDCCWDALVLAGEGAQTECYTLAKHGSRQCYSKQTIRSVLSGNAHATCHNGIYVAEHAVQTDAQLQNRNLLLSTQARVNTKPELEIYNDDVSCSHGATVGCLDDEAIFYLRSRGVSEQQARNMLLHAFVKDVLKNVQDVNLSNIMEDTVQSFLDAFEVEGGVR